MHKSTFLASGKQLGSSAADNQKPICIMGTPVSSGNRGVLALGASLVNLCSEATGRGATLLLGHRDNRPVRLRIGTEFRDIEIVNVRMSPRSRIRDHLFWVLGVSLVYRFLPVSFVRRSILDSTPWVKAIATSAFVGDVRGGDSFSDIYGLKRFVSGFALAWTVILVRGSLVQFPQTYGPYRHAVSRLLARYLLRHSSIILARDRESLRIAGSLVGPNGNVRLSPDVAFSLAPLIPSSIILEPPSSCGAEDDGVIGFNVNGLMYHGGYTRNNMFGLSLDYRLFLATSIACLLKHSESEIWLIPHTYAPAGDIESDLDSARQVRDSIPESLRGRVRVLVREYDCHELKGIIGMCDFFVGSRMHACIGALSQGVPCVGVAYSMKFRGVFETVDMGDWVVDARYRTTEEAVSDVLTRYQQRDRVRADLAKAASAARRELREVFAELGRAELSRPSPHA